MNKTSIPARELRHILTGFRKIVPRGEPESRRIQVTFGPGVQLMATDGTAVLTYAIHTKSSIMGTYLVSFDDLADFARGLPARSEVTIERHEKHLSFLAEDRVFHALPARDTTPFLPAPRLAGKVHPVTPQDREAILRAMTCTSKDETRYILKGILVEDSRVVATDGRTLYHEILHDLPVENPFIMPASPLIKWQGLGAEWQLKTTSGKKVPVMIELRSGPWSLTLPAITGNFPNWRQVLPEERKLPSQLRLGDKDIAILRTLTNDSIGLVARDGIVSFLQLSEDGKQWQSYRATGSLAKGPDAFIFLNREFLHRALDAGLSELLVGKELDPCLFKGRGHMVVMPLRVTGPPLPGDKPKNNNPIESRPERTQAPKTMNGKTPPKNNTTPLETVQESLRTLKGQLRESIGHVDTALRQLRDAQADQRATQKDIKTIRGTLQSLREVAFPS